MITRAASGATYNSTEGRIEGTSSAAFTDGKSGGFGGLKENSNFSIGASYYGDLFNGLSPLSWIISNGPVDTFGNGCGVSSGNYGAGGSVANAGAGGVNMSTGLTDDVLGIASLGMRRDTGDGTATLRGYVNGTEVSTANATVSSTSDIGTVARPFYFGSTATGTGNTKLFFECCWFGTGMSTADLAAITADPSSVIEVVPADTTAPVLSSPVGTQTGSTTATTGATTDEANGVLYVVVTTSATQPSVVQIKAGQNDGGTTAVYAGNVAVSSIGAKTINATGLAASTAYYAHLVHADAAGNNSNRVASAQFTTAAGGDVTAPVLTSPTGTQTGSSSANVGATTDEANGTMYAVCSTSNTAPTTTQIQAGQIHTGATAPASGSLAISSTGAKSIGMSGLSPSTLYYGHVFHRDAAGNASNVVTSASFTTTAGGSFKSRAFYDRLIGAMHV